MSRSFSERRRSRGGALACAGLVLAGCAGLRDERVDRTESALGASFAYAFAPSGLPIVADGGSITRTPGVWIVVGERYLLDSFGRVTARGDRTFTYGPDGQIASATSSTGTVTYTYDETGHRLYKSRGGSPIAAYLDEGVLTDAELIEPLAVARSVVGIVQGGRFTMLATDARGTVVADRDGTARPSSPFGARDVEPDVAEAIDYAHKALDPDIGATRMGIRDYDAKSASFLQPDPLVLAAPSKCVEGPYDCNLYGYARGNPASYVDPAGTFPFYLHHAINDTWGHAEGLSAQSITTINKASDAMDNAPHSQDAVNSHYHAMSDATHHETAADARATADTFVHDMAKLAGFLAATGDMRGRDIALGMAFHTVEDSHSRAHGGEDGGGAPWGTTWMGLSTPRQVLGFLFSHVPGDMHAVNVPGMAQQMTGVYDEARHWESFLRDPGHMDDYGGTILSHAYRHSVVRGVMNEVR